MFSDEAEVFASRLNLSSLRLEFFAGLMQIDFLVSEDKSVPDGIHDYHCVTA